MKGKWYLFLFTIALPGFLWAQQLPRQVISTAGNNSTAGGVSLSWTVGQAGPTASTSPSSFYITQGYQQGDELYVSINGLVVSNTTFSVYPNPSSGIFHISGILPAGGESNYRILDMQGMEMKRGYFNADYQGNIQSEFNLSFLPDGSYIFKLSGGEGSQNYACSYKLTIVK